MSDTTRRKMLTQSAAALAALGVLGRTAFADVKKQAKKARLAGKDLSDLEAKHPQGSDSVSMKVSGHSEKIGKLLLQKMKAMAMIAVIAPNIKFPSNSVQAAVAKK